MIAPLYLHDISRIQPVSRAAAAQLETSVHENHPSCAPEQGEEMAMRLPNPLCFKQAALPLKECALL